MPVSSETRRGGAVLVTGASAGLGAAFAEALAADGRDLVLTARREDRLKALAARLRAAHGVDALAVSADLAEPAAPDRIAAATRAAGVHVGGLINNAGFGVPGFLADAPWPRHRATLEAMAAAPVRLCHLFAPAMVERGAGLIVNVSSLAALVPPHAGGTLYYPVKSFLLQFSLAFGEEVRRDGVQVCAVCPGFVRTEFQQAAGGTVESVALPDFLWMSPEDVAKRALRAARRGDAVCVPGRIDRIIALAFKLMPGALGRRLVRGDARPGVRTRPPD